MQCVGKGAYGTVHKVRERATGREYAMKLLKRGPGVDQSIDRELLNHRLLAPHPNVIGFKEVSGTLQSRQRARHGATGCGTGGRTYGDVCGRWTSPHASPSAFARWSNEHAAPENIKHHLHQCEHQSHATAHCPLHVVELVRSYCTTAHALLRCPAGYPTCLMHILLPPACSYSASKSHRRFSCGPQ